MALSKDKKRDVVEQTQFLLKKSKMTVIAKYPGTSVKAMQALRDNSKKTGTTVRVIKNRLFKKALEGTDTLAGIDTSCIVGQLLYAFNQDDEVAPAQDLAAFAKTNPQLTFVGAITDDGKFLSADEVTLLASLPSKDQLRAQLIGTLSAPSTGFVNVVAGNIRSILNVLNARSQSI